MSTPRNSVVHSVTGFMQPFLYALVFLTRLPVAGLLRNVDAETAKRSVYYYPLVGLIVGALLCAATYVLSPLPAQLQAALLLGFWVLVTGALHLDGLADCADAYFAGHKCMDTEERRTRILAVMHDPHCGAMGVIALVIFLLVKFAVLSALLEWLATTEQGTWIYLPLLLAPVLARTAALFLMSLSSYARAQGLVPPSNSQRNRELLPVAILVAVAGIALAPLPVAIGLAAVLPAVILLWRQLWQKQIGGYTGDCLGGLVEITELSVLLLWVALAANGIA
ncbi:adenosylcobinamide-GDP ribazoletransferase [Microbulbifer sp. Q7]|uniref:adenosylcobinamide-GDP ribazoletransferase n=1 Tax=Microbulbifer sp. Q7 TaxID=1785091 RepID=UPI001D1161AF|nr:adenosylcobinamide-GDP ribazoletransferase [Microbulbifer sp. Q7]